ncbi:MAG: hypothetical protein KKE39_00060 [Bacteroidetes bacterium]|nr:hypothetical protein [Bacteroidota bacterium]MBU1373074.1 hypothetical protein [Bacteroidota bacterium]MBU1484255.1 hypothetical protein [Bacteroidota bacterium]MBU1759952.1 hypothetical protein [Bacteroidota bacterium]MBU2268221.1 hypothetical protein [Bacteroidota bacterium]
MENIKKKKSLQIIYLAMIPVTLSTLKQGIESGVLWRIVLSALSSLVFIICSIIIYFSNRKRQQTVS